MSKKHDCGHGTPCDKVVENLCDMIEVKLGRQKATEMCKKMLAHVQDCPNCCSEVETLTKTVEVYQQIPGKLVPLEVENRLLSFLKIK